MELYNSDIHSLSSPLARISECTKIPSLYYNLYQFSQVIRVKATGGGFECRVVGVAMRFCAAVAAKYAWKDRKACTGAPCAYQALRRVFFGSNPAWSVVTGLNCCSIV